MTWRHFSLGEFVCPCCNVEAMEWGFVGRLQRLRDEYGKVIQVTRGWNCYEYDSDHYKGYGVHPTGHAADVVIPRKNVHEFLYLAFREAFTGIGVRAHGDRRFIHLDDLGYGPAWVNKRPWFWTYE